MIESIKKKIKVKNDAKTTEPEIELIAMVTNLAKS